MSQVAVIGLFLIALLWAAYVAQPVVVPVVLAWTIATIVLPVVTWMQATASRAGRRRCCW